MKNLILANLLLMAPMGAWAHHGNEVEHAAHQEVSAEQLKSWYDQGVKMTVVDARSKPYFNRELLPKAFWLSAESSKEAILKALPQKDALIVVYCSGPTCPASGMLFDKLTSLGYANVYEYHGGLKEWLSNGYQTVRQ